MQVYEEKNKKCKAEVAKANQEAYENMYEDVRT
jgi:hypothetical protein